MHTIAQDGRISSTEGGRAVWIHWGEASQVSGRFSFESYELDSIERVLRQGRQFVRLSSRQFDLLAVLVQRRGAVVTKDELLNRVWPEAAVEENNVAVHVSGLRRLLGRTSIETVSGQGYRFAWPVDVEHWPHEGEATPGAAAGAGAPRDLPGMPQELQGRKTEAAALLVLAATNRLVTIVGAPGVGKSTLALAHARAEQAHIEGEVVWVDLARDDASLPVLACVAMALGVDPRADSGPVLATLSSTAALLVIDNAEVDADAVAAFVQQALDSVQSLRVIVTSRRVLRVSGEKVFRLLPLPLPLHGSPWQEALRNDAVALFMNQARSHGRPIDVGPHDVEAVVELCRRLDGLPLAILLAAGRLQVFSLDQLRERLQDRFRLLTRATATGPRRLHSLRASMNLSLALLRPVERQVFLHLARLDGVFTLDQLTAALSGSRLEAWDIADALDGLIDHSLVQLDPGPTPRYRLLESIRAYAQRLFDEDGRTRSSARRHADAVRALFDSASRIQAMKHGAPYLEDFVPDIERLRAALDGHLVEDANAAGELMTFCRNLCELLSLTYCARRSTAGVSSGAAAPEALPAPHSR